MRMLRGFLLSSLLASGLILTAQETPPVTRPNPAANRTDRPLSGKVIAVDSSVRSIMIGPSDGVGSITSNIVCMVATNSIIIKGGKRVQLAEVPTGEPIRFRTRPGPDGKPTATFLFVGQPPLRQAPGMRPAAPLTPGR